MHAPLARPVRQFGVVNWQGLWTLYLREVRRFLKVSMQTVFAPVVSTLIFLMIFLLAMNGQSRSMDGVPFLQFLAPGLVMMSVTQNAFANTTSSIMIMKMQGNIVDLLMPPISAFELTVGLALGGLTRGLMVGVVVTAAMAVFVHIGIASLWAALFYASAASMLLSVLGIIGAIWADKFDHLAAVTNFIVTPLAFLSGTFYSIKQLPPLWHTIALCNPFFYMIDGFRYGLTGQAEAPPLLGVAILLAINAALLGLAYLMIERGYKLKA
ncbi:MAG TPA: ABC transporter permease [Stellaceae bacterium]|nr:ABC transporter permease [Stellaceae bacterium]